MIICYICYIEYTYIIDTVSLCIIYISWMMGFWVYLKTHWYQLLLFPSSCPFRFPKHSSIPASTRDAQLEDWSCCPLDRLGSQCRNHQSSTPAERSYLGRCCEPQRKKLGVWKLETKIRNLQNPTNILREWRTVQTKDIASRWIMFIECSNQPDHYSLEWRHKYTKHTSCLDLHIQLQRSQKWKRNQQDHKWI